MHCIHLATVILIHGKEFQLALSDEQAAQIARDLSDTDKDSAWVFGTMIQAIGLDKMSDMIIGMVTYKSDPEMWDGFIQITDKVSGNLMTLVQAEVDRSSAIMKHILIELKEAQDAGTADSSSGQ
ncbi:hypothetical protein LCGC14_1276450 [marine sediment metagenome]|uniref:Uncharacterized protein n=1 Tax=marine sediment metagenome TaxID=412755 RepID=A0A0F9KWK3_9ZZZZ